MSPRTQLWAPCALVLLLAACGGGSSSDTSSTSDTPAPDAPMTTDPAPSTPGSLDPVPDSFGTSDEAYNAHNARALHAGVVRSAIAAVVVPPHLDSVTQSASGQAATATTDGRSFAVTIPGPNGGTLTLDTATDAVWRETFRGSRFSDDDTLHDAEFYRPPPRGSTAAPPRYTSILPGFG